MLQRLADFRAARQLEHRADCPGPLIEVFDVGVPGRVERQPGWPETYRRQPATSARVVRCGGCGAQEVRNG